MHWCWGGDGRAVPAAERNSPCKGPEAGEQCGTQGRVSRKVPVSAGVPELTPPFAPSGVLVSHDILPRAARMFS